MLQTILPRKVCESPQRFESSWLSRQLDNNNNATANASVRLTCCSEDFCSNQSNGTDGGSGGVGSVLPAAATSTRFGGGQTFGGGEDSATVEPGSRRDANHPAG